MTSVVTSSSTPDVTHHGARSVGVAAEVCQMGQTHPLHRDDDPADQRDRRHRDEEPEATPVTDGHTGRKELEHAEALEPQRLRSDLPQVPQRGRQQHCRRRGQEIADEMPAAAGCTSVREGHAGSGVDEGRQHANSAGNCESPHSMLL